MRLKQEIMKLKSSTLAAYKVNCKNAAFLLKNPAHYSLSE